MNEAEFKRQEQAKDPWERQEVCTFCGEEECCCNLSECCGARINDDGICRECRDHT